MRRRTGLALVLVLTIILALVLIATPFVLSMIKQERVATTEKAERQATYGSEGVRNFGVATLLGGLDANERQGTTGVWNTPYSDVESEFSIDLRDSRLASLKILDPQGKIWGVTAEDEQAKIDIRTAPERVLQTLRTYVDTRVIDLKDVTTMYAGRNARWIFPQSIRGTGPYPPSPSGVLVDDATHYGRDATVRFVGPGSSALITRVRRNFLISDGWPVIETVDPAPPGATMVEVEARHPVNLNTARRETLAALLEGIRIDVGLQQRDEISRQEALDLAAQIAGRTIESWQEFAQFLEQSNVGTPLDRLAVLLNFMDPTNADLDGTGTMPGCFVSHDTATLQTRAMMNTPAGTPVSGVGFREVLDVGPPVPTTWTLESQHDFDAFFRAAAAGSQAYAATPPIPMTYFGGYPWGGRIVTFPNAPPNPSDKTRSVQAYIQLDHARDMRGVGQYLNFRDHFDAEIEGRALNGGPQTYPWRSAFARNPEPPSPTALLNAPDIAAGGTEFWVRFDAIAPIVLFDVQESPMANRITLEHTGTDLLLTVTDATLPDPNPKGIDKGLAEIRMPFVPMQDTWYHIGVYWKGTRWAHLAMLVDGFAHPQATFAHVTPQGVPMITELAGPLPAPKAGDPPTTPLSLRNGGWIPQPPPNELPPIQPEPPLPAVPTEPNYIPLLIGDEVVHLDLAKRTVWRGMRGTTSRDHPAGVKVQLFGYSSKLRPLNLRRGGVMAQFNKLPATAGQIDLDFDANPSASVVGDKSDATGRFVDSSQDFVQATSVDDFPERGYIKIDNEVIYYDALERGGTPRFAKCQRAQEKTTAARHDDGAVIECWCVPVTSTRGYLSPTFIQVEEEWFGPVKIADGRPNFWVGVSVGSPPLPDPFSRAIEGSRRTAHRRGENVIPVFAVADSDPGVNRLNCQRWDRVTLVDGADSRVSARVRRSTGVSNVLQLVALWEPVKRDYLPDEQHVRLLKWPSGELLSLSWLQNADPQVSFGPGGIMIDEVKFLASPKGPFATSAVTDSSTRLIRMNGVSALGTEGAIKVGDEIIGYADVDAKSGELRECSRGWLNSRADVHAQGEPAFNMSFLPISCLSAGVGAQDRAFTVRSPLEGGYRPGYALIDEEVVGFENFSNMATGAVYECSPDVQGQVLWRGRFGTAAQSHAQDALVYGIPSRYWDTYRPQQFDDEMAYFQASITRRGARWRTVQWQQEVPQDDPLVRTHCLVRADGMGEFTDAPVRDGRTQLWDFTTPNAPNAIDYVSGRRDAGQLDARFYVEYLPGAYWPNHAWKRSPKIQRLQVEMERPTRVLYHEDD